MDKLPVEILHRIFIELHLRQRIECTLVCRLWTRTLRERSLFHTVIIENEFMCHKFLEYIERFPLRARQVERLELSNCLPIDYDKRKLCTIFPNVRVVKAKSAFYQDAVQFHQKPVEFTLPDGQIEELADYEECELAYALIASGLCSQLTRLHLDTHFTSDSFIHYIPSLKNMPVLKKLTTVGFVIRIDDMETIHYNLPSLETLEFDRCMVKNSILPLDIEPCALKYLRMSVYEKKNHENSDIEWFMYIGAKYPSLTEISLWNAKLDEPDSNNFHYGIAPIITSRKGGGQMKSIGPVYYYPGTNVYENIDKSGIQLKTLKINFRAKVPELDKLINSSQVKSIEELHLSGMATFPFVFLTKMPNLKKLYITGDISFVEDDDLPNQYYDFLFDTLLSNLPKTVHTLSIENVCLILASRTTRAHPGIKELDLKNVELIGDYNKFIGSTFPGLKTLRLDNALALIEPVELEELDLSLLEVELSRVSSEMIDVSLTTLNNNTTKDYPVKSQLFFSQYIEPDLYIDHRNQVFPQPIDRSRYLQIKCNSVRTLVVNRVVYPS